MKSQTMSPTEAADSLRKQTSAKASMVGWWSKAAVRAARLRTASPSARREGVGVSTATNTSGRPS